MTINNQKKNSIFELMEIKSFRNGQLKPIKNILSKKDTLVLKPTGAGKSLIFQFAGLYLDGVTIVISPLISLMKDQVDKLNKLGINSVYYNHTLTNEEKKEFWDNLRDDNYKFVYISPERLSINNFAEEFNAIANVKLIAIDESHCISMWGHDFREEYLNLPKMKDIFKNVPIVCLTASADSVTKKEIMEKFNISESSLFEEPVERTNINYFIEKKHQDGIEQIYEIIKTKRNKKGIIYCFTKKDVNKLSAFLRKKGKKSDRYHSDLSDNKREQVLRDFMNGKIDYVVSTIAFGMGIDKKDIGFVIHKEIPMSIESFYQESGRAGRDGKESESILLYSGRDKVKINWIMNSKKINDKKKFNIMTKYVEITECRKNIINWYFGFGKLKYKCGKCDVCKSKTSTTKQNELIKIINNQLEKTFFFDQINEEILKGTNLTKDEVNNYFYQLVFNGYIGYNIIEDNYILIKKIPLSFLFNENINLGLNYIPKTKTAKKTPTKRKPKKKTITKTKTKATVKKKRTLSKEHIKKMQEGRRKKRNSEK